MSYSTKDYIYIRPSVPPWTSASQSVCIILGNLKTNKIKRLQKISDILSNTVVGVSRDPQQHSILFYSISCINLLTVHIFAFGECIRTRKE